jgi:D-arabinan endo alpha-(1,5)-arabinofuranosidase
MSPRPRITSISVASAAAIGLSVAIGVAPPATAEPCTGAAAAAQPPADPAPTPPMPASTGGPPTGHRPPNANERAPLPRLGQLPRALLNAFGLSPRTSRVQQQAAVVPAPVPPGTGNQPPPNAIQQAPAPAAATPPPPASPPGTSLVGWVTGPDSPNDTIKRFAITGTDLGIMWDNGDPVNRQVLMAFGDTYGYCSVRGQQWRYNTLFRSQDGALAKTIAVSDGVVANRYSGSPLLRPGISKPILPGIKWAPTEKGMIPTAGISVGNTQYLNYMSIKNWDSDGRWTTNYSAIAVSPDNGENWGIYPGSVRTPAPDSIAEVPYVPGNENFQQGAFLRPGPGDPYLYSFGTPSGRGGAAFVARVLPGYVPAPNKYEYWNSAQNAWIPNNPAAATPVIPGPVGEMSAQYNTYLKQYLVMYGNGANDVVMRAAPAPQGPWGPEQLLVPSMQIPGGIYAPFLHPWSTGRELYYNLSLWSAYNVMLMKTVLP